MPPTTFIPLFSEGRGPGWGVGGRRQAGPVRDRRSRETQRPDKVEERKVFGGRREVAMEQRGEKASHSGPPRRPPPPRQRPRPGPAAAPGWLPAPLLRTVPNPGPHPRVRRAYLGRSCSASRGASSAQAAGFLPGPRAPPPGPSEGRSRPRGCRAKGVLRATQAGVRRPRDAKGRKKERKCVIGWKGEGNAKPDRK